MANRPTARKRKIGVHVSLDLDALDQLDAAAERNGLTRSELIRRMIEDWIEGEEEQHWAREEAQAALDEERIPWKQAKAELGL